jgi:RNA polymerase sigma-70 factor, ECF subfamily
MHLSSTAAPAELAPPGRPPADPSDARVIARSMLEPQAFATVFDRHWAALHAFCTSRAGTAGEDLAAETFRLAFDRRERYDRSYEDARPWLYGIAMNLLRQHFRSGRRGRTAAARLQARELDHGDEPLGKLEAQMLGPRLSAALAELSTADRDALLLLAWAELDYAEISRALEIPVGTVRSRIHRARARVRAYLNERNHDDR